MQFTAAIAAAVLATVASAQTLNIPTRVGSIISLPAKSSIPIAFDGGNREYDRRGMTCNTDKNTNDGIVFELANGATLSNVIIGVNQLEGVHCLGACTLRNVWFRDVCEDAISLLGTGNVLIEGGGAQQAKDKVIQHNGRGTVTVRNFTVVGVGKLYRSCGDCSKNGGPRKVVVTGLRANGIGSDIIGINSNYGDTATVSGSCGQGVKRVCQEYKGIDKDVTSGESPKVSSTSACLGAQGKLTGIPAC